MEWNSREFICCFCLLKLETEILTDLCFEEAGLESCFNSNSVLLKQLSNDVPILVFL